MRKMYAQMHDPKDQEETTETVEGTEETTTDEGAGEGAE